MPEISDINNAYCLLKLGDSITTDHIIPGGKIRKNSPAARFLQNKGISSNDLNTYASRRGNYEVLCRGTFANIRLINQLASGPGPITIHIPTGKEMTIFEASEAYQKENHSLIILAGKDYGSGSSRDWAAKGPLLQGIKAIIAESFEKIHRSNLVSVGVLPLQFKEGENAEKLGITGRERFSIKLNRGDIRVKQEIIIQTDTGVEFNVIAKINTELEVEYYKNTGILPFVIRKFVNN